MIFPLVKAENKDYKWNIIEDSKFFHDSVLIQQMNALKFQAQNSFMKFFAAFRSDLHSMVQHKIPGGKSISLLSCVTHYQITTCVDGNP